MKTWELWNWMGLVKQHGELFTRKVGLYSAPRLSSKGLTVTRSEERKGWNEVSLQEGSCLLCGPKACWTRKIESLRHHTEYEAAGVVWPPGTGSSCAFVTVTHIWTSRKKKKTSYKNKCTEIFDQIFILLRFSAQCKMLIGILVCLLKTVCICIVLNTVFRPQGGDFTSGSWVYVQK